VARTEICPICQYQVLEFSNDSNRPPLAFCPSCFATCPSEMNAGDLEDVGHLPCFKCAKEGCSLATGASQIPIGTCSLCGQSILLKKGQEPGKFYSICGLKCIGCRTEVFVPTSAKEVSIAPGGECTSCPGFRMLKFKFGFGQVPVGIPFEMVECAKTTCRSHSRGGLPCLFGRFEEMGAAVLTKFVFSTVKKIILNSWKLREAWAVLRAPAMFQCEVVHLLLLFCLSLCLRLQEFP